jgi:hypothetical protein
MKHKNILKHITGISTPIFGIQWAPPTFDKDVAQGVITFLEDKRVLFNSMHMESANHCVTSVQNIRQELTRFLQSLGDKNSPLGKKIKAMRLAARHFIDKVGGQGFPKFDTTIQTSILERELFKLREKFGKHIAEIAISYGHDVENDLAVIMPFNNV